MFDDDCAKIDMMREVAVYKKKLPTRKRRKNVWWVSAESQSWSQKESSCCLLSKEKLKVRSWRFHSSRFTGYLSNGDYNEAHAWVQGTAGSAAAKICCTGSWREDCDYIKHYLNSIQCFTCKPERPPCVALKKKSKIYDKEWMKKELDKIIEKQINLILETIGLKI